MARRAGMRTARRATKELRSPIPDFLWGFVGSLNLMRLSFEKGAHAVISRAAYRKFRASRALSPHSDSFH
jgi:hypothetical protein